MSLRRGNRKKGAPKHQNKFGFRHNKNSKKSVAIMALPNTGLCRRCHDKIEWRKKYRKYKPLKAPRKCAACDKKRVVQAYHVVCEDCAKDKGVCAKCLQAEPIVDPDNDEDGVAAQLDRLESGPVPGMKERERRALIRQLYKELEGSDEEEEGGDKAGGDKADSDGHGEAATAGEGGAEEAKGRDLDPDTSDSEVEDAAPRTGRSRAIAAAAAPAAAPAAASGTAAMVSGGTGDEVGAGTAPTEPPSSAARVAPAVGGVSAAGVAGVPDGLGATRGSSGSGGAGGAGETTTPSM